MKTEDFSCVFVSQQVHAPVSAAHVFWQSPAKEEDLLYNVHSEIVSKACLFHLLLLRHDMLGIRLTRFYSEVFK